MSNEAFWATTPRQFNYLVERHREQIKREDRRAGGIIAASYNLNRTSETDPLYDWDDFFTEWKKAKPPMEDQTEEEMLQMMLMLTRKTEGLNS